jgi:NADPH:quinone reductase-like Zn-dependent oxidoreductase
MSPELAAALPTSGAIGLVVTEWTDPKPGQTILVIGATGGVGGFVSQHLAHAGATVVTLNRPDHDAYARERGASATFDYSAPDLEAQLREAYPARFDAFIDLSGDKGLCERMMALIKPWGRCSSTAFGIDPEAEAARELTAQNVNEDAASRIGEIVEMIQSGKLIPPDVQAYPFEQVPDALAAQASRHVRGKLVLNIGS